MSEQMIIMVAVSFTLSFAPTPRPAASRAVHELARLVGDLFLEAGPAPAGLQIQRRQNERLDGGSRLELLVGPISTVWPCRSSTKRSSSPDRSKAPPQCAFPASYFYPYRNPSFSLSVILYPSVKPRRILSSVLATTTKSTNSTISQIPTVITGCFQRNAGVAEEDGFHLILGEALFAAGHRPAAAFWSSRSVPACRRCRQSHCPDR